MKTKTFAATKESLELARKYAYKEWIISRFMHYIPNVYEFLIRMEKPTQPYIRVNSLKTTKSELQTSLINRGFELENTFIDEVFKVKKAPHSLGATPEYLFGYYYIQDLSSSISVVALSPKENETILDMCAAPGGKTTHIAQRMSNTGLLVATESNRERIYSLISNLNRCGVVNTCVYNLDATEIDKLGQKYDRILLDAPCTCEGVIPRDVTRKTSHTPDDIEYCNRRQVKLIETAIKLAKPGSILVYSTCSFAPEENEMIIDYALRKYDLEVLPLHYGSEGLTQFADMRFDSRVKNTRRFYPHLHNTLGFYVAKITVK